MKRYLYYLFMAVSILSLTLSCKEEVESSKMKPCQSPPRLFDIDIIGTVYFDSVSAEPVIYVNAEQARYCLPSCEFEHEGMILTSHNGKFLQEGNDSILKPGEIVGFKVDSAFMTPTTLFVPIRYKGRSFLNFSVLLKEVERLTSEGPDYICGTKDDYVIIDSRTSDESVVYPKAVNLDIHILRNSDGSGGALAEEAKASISKSLSRSFGSTGIKINIRSVDYINYFTPSLREKFSFNDLSTLNPIYRLRNDGSCIHMYIKDSDGFKEEYVPGISQSIPGNACIVRSDFITSDEYTVGHELGHCLGLCHTHRGTSKYVREKYGLTATKGEDGIPELVDGSNSSVAGDYVSDTPADPNLSWHQTGYTGSDKYKDANGDSYRPNKYNIMSYSWQAISFTQEQARIMHGTLHYKMRDVMPNLIIEGPRHFKDKGSFKVAYNTGTQYTWNVTNYMESSMDDAEPILSETSITTDVLNLTSNKSTLHVIELIDVKTGIKYGQSKATSGPPSPYTGSLMWKTSATSTWQGATTNKEWGNTLYVSGNTMLFLGYEDSAGASISDVHYRTVTATNRVLEGASITVNQADCARGFLKFRLSDGCGTGGSYFTIPVAIIGNYYTAEVIENKTVRFLAKNGIINKNQLSTSAKRHTIGTIVLTDSNGKLIKKVENLDVSTFEFDLSNIPSGDYNATISDGKDYSQQVFFSI